MNDTDLNGRLIFVREDREAGNDGSSGTSVYVGNLSWDVAWQDLKDHFKSVGEVSRAEVMTGNDGRSKGCGLVTFADPSDAQTAIATLNDTDLNGRLIFVREDREAGNDGSSGTSVYVGNLSWDVAWQDLKDHFKSVGEVSRAEVMTGNDGRSKGCGLVTFADPSDAQTAIATLNDTELNGRLMFVREDRE